LIDEKLRFLAHGFDLAADDGEDLIFVLFEFRDEVLIDGIDYLMDFAVVDLDWGFGLSLG
jgi:hypothetical protein